MPRPSRSIARLLIAVILLTAFLPGASGLYDAIVDPQWVLLPDVALGVSLPAISSTDEQPVSLLSLLPSRAPPLLSLA
jgi:hypothetical protein